jgi:hypothetical protein
MKSTILQPDHTTHSEDQQMCALLVQILDNQDFSPDHVIETTNTLDILDEYKSTEHTDQLPDSEECVQ